MAESKKTLREWMAERGHSNEELGKAASVDAKVVEAIAAARYTTSPAQRQRLADALGIALEEIQFGSAVEVDHMYGHGPQFGRSP
jgi:ribosome-binding protein aMBF1 (putative translation factor)